MNTDAVSEKKQRNDDEIDFLELLNIFWAERWLVVGITAVAAMISVAVSLMLTEIYRAEIILAPAEEEAGSSGLVGQLGGAATLLGVNVGGRSGDTISTALAILQSRQFIGKFIDDNDLDVPLFAGIWNKKERLSEIDFDIYNPVDGEWLLDGGKPSKQDSYRKFRSLMSVSGPNLDTGIVTLAISWHDPNQAAEWSNKLIQNLNDHMRDQSVYEATNAIAYLRQQLELTQLVEMQQVFYQLIEAQTRITMLANVRPEYVFRVIDPAVTPDRKSAPRRALICVIGTILGGMLAIIIVFLRRLYRYS